MISAIGAAVFWLVVFIVGTVAFVEILVRFASWIRKGEDNDNAA